MLAEMLRLLLVVVLFVALPGWLLVNAVFPPGRSALRGMERAYVSVAGGILLLIFVGVVLGLLPHQDSHGFFQTFATGLPNVELAMIGTSILLGYIGLQRGAYPRVAARFPHLLGEDQAASAPKGTDLQMR